jgi:hypothetical protein
MPTSERSSINDEASIRPAIIPSGLLIEEAKGREKDGIAAPK